jgi:hypothetical protein
MISSLPGRLCIGTDLDACLEEVGKDFSHCGPKGINIIHFAQILLPQPIRNTSGSIGLCQLP